MMYSLSPEGGAPGANSEDAGGLAISPTADEVQGSALPLVEAINRGEIEPPERPLAWQEWTTWRAAAGARPRQTSACSQKESRLWKTTMSSLFGEDWRAELATARALAVEHASRSPDRRGGASTPSEEVSPSPEGRNVWSSPPRSRPGAEDAEADEKQSSVGSEGSWRNMSNEEVETVLTDAFRVKEETLAAYERRVARARAVLQLRGIVSDANAARKNIEVARIASQYYNGGGSAALQEVIELSLIHI